MEADKIHIVSDGKIYGTRIYAVCENGEEVELTRIKSAAWKAVAGEHPECDLEHFVPSLENGSIDAYVDADYVTIKENKFKVCKG